MSKARSKMNVPFAARVTTALAVGALAATAMAGCSSDKVASSVPTTTPAVVAPTVAGVNPLTGLAGLPKGPVVAVKVDDTADGRPSMGLEKADVIYIEEVEGGLSRMVAVFASAKPNVRAVRSIRSSDMELLGQYGKIVAVASGGAPATMRALDRSSLQSVIHDRGQVGFSRDRSRPAPYNVVSDLAKVSAAKSKADGVRDVGFTWAAEDARLASAKPAISVKTRVGTTPVDFAWEAKLARYVRTVSGKRILTAGGAAVGRPNVLVQFCQIKTNSADIDTNGSPTMFTKTVGSGSVVLFRDGKRIVGKWSRPTLEAPTTFTDAAGQPLLFAPGGTFVALVRQGAPA